jgi:hypothetical protein
MRWRADEAALTTEMKKRAIRRSMPLEVHFRFTRSASPCAPHSQAGTGALLTGRRPAAPSRSSSRLPRRSERRRACAGEAEPMPGTVVIRHGTRELRRKGDTKQRPSCTGPLTRAPQLITEAAPRRPGLQKRTTLSPPRRAPSRKLVAVAVGHILALAGLALAEPGRDGELDKRTDVFRATLRSRSTSLRGRASRVPSVQGERWTPREGGEETPLDGAPGIRVPLPRATRRPDGAIDAAPDAVPITHRLPRHRQGREVVDAAAQG